MKLQSKNIIYRIATAKCFICSKSQFGDVRLPPHMFLRCRDYESKCPISNLFNNNIFKL